MQAIPYLNFDGDCKQAFEFYLQVLGGDLSVRTHGDSPIADEVAPDWHDRVLHAYLKNGNMVLMASDSPPGKHEAPSGIYVSLNGVDVDEGKRIFDGLSEGGRITMAFEKTFWSPGFGMFHDRFGIPWMVNCVEVGAPA